MTRGYFYSLKPRVRTSGLLVRQGYLRVSCDVDYYADLAAGLVSGSEIEPAVQLVADECVAVADEALAAHAEASPVLLAVLEPDSVQPGLVALAGGLETSA